MGIREPIVTDIHLSGISFGIAYSQGDRRKFFFNGLGPIACDFWKRDDAPVANRMEFIQGFQILAKFLSIAGPLLAKG